MPHNILHVLQCAVNARQRCLKEIGSKGEASTEGDALFIAVLGQAWSILAPGYNSKSFDNGQHLDREMTETKQSQAHPQMYDNDSSMRQRILQVDVSIIRWSSLHLESTSQ